MTDCQTACKMMENQFRSGGHMPFCDTLFGDPHDDFDETKQFNRDTFGTVRLSDDLVEEDDSWIDPELNFFGISGTMHIWE